MSHEISNASIGRYRVERSLGDARWEAFDPELDRPVVIERMREHAQALARVRHPNVATVHDAGDGYVAMERVDGETLASWLGGRRSRAARARVLGGVARGLAALAGAGLETRSIGADDVVIDRDGEPRIVRFGGGRGGLHAIVARRHRWIAIVSAAAIIAIAIAALRADDAPDVCARAGELPFDVWSASRAVRVRAAFHATSLPFADDAATRAIASLDAWAPRWSALRTAACRAHDDDRAACLDDRARTVGALATELGGADAATVAHAGAAVDDAIELGPCARSIGAVSDEESRLRVALATARALFIAGRYQGAITAADAIAGAAARAKLPAVEAQARTAITDAYMAERNWDAARAADQRALLAAEAAGDDVSRVRLLLVESSLDGLDDRTDAADRELAQARAIADRLHDPAIDEDVAFAAGLRAAVRDVDDGVTQLERAIASRRARLGRDDQTIASMTARIGFAYFEHDRYDAAFDAFTRALALQERLLGRDHPELIETLDGLGSVLDAQGRYDDAIPVLRRGLAIAEAPGGDTHGQLVMIASTLGATLAQVGRAGEAMPLVDRAFELAAADGAPPATLESFRQLRAYTRQLAGKPELALDDYDLSLANLEARFGKDSLELQYALEGRGSALRDLGRLAEAQDTFARELAIMDRFAHDSDDRFTPEYELGEILLSLSRPAEAIPHLERALAIRDGKVGDPSDLADAQFALARALIATRGDRVRAFALAHAARSGYENARPERTRVEDVEAWLAENR
ncbi:MAG TPA: tetratricopeptide repeat-containing protein kinase family protein [Kofleriaceae bacterium]|nr:tetratricopeptide repeat-containing protein kinase family protein [Kofleriaceae bacterium]